MFRCLISVILRKNDVIDTVSKQLKCVLNVALNMAVTGILTKGLIESVNVRKRQNQPAPRCRYGTDINCYNLFINSQNVLKLSHFLSST